MNGAQKSQVSFLQNPILFLKTKYDNFQEEQHARNAITQNDYFIMQTRWIAETKRQLLILGYDQTLMEYKEIQEQLLNAAKGIGPYRKNGRVQISVIVPNNLESEILNELKDETSFVQIYRVNNEILSGYIVYDNWRFSAWNSEKLTSHPIEKEQGVIARVSIVSENYAKRISELHNAAVQKIIAQSSKQQS